MPDEPRLLHRQSERGYTTRSIEALVAEPEAVPADYQDVVTARSQLRGERATRRVRDEQRAEVGRILEWVVGLVPAVEATREVHALRHALKRLDRRLAS